LTLLVGNKVTIIYDATGTPIVISPAAPLVGGKSVYMPTVSGKSVLVPLSTPIVGEKVYIAPSSSGKNIIIKSGINLGNLHGLTIIGGVVSDYPAGVAAADVWAAIHGLVSWTQLTSSAEWSPSTPFCAVVMSDKSIVIVGGTTTKAWRSPDGGITWVLQTANTGMGARRQPAVCRLSDDTIILSGGWVDHTKSDVWRSTDYGITWNKICDPWPLSSREGHGMVTMSDDSIVVVGGQGEWGEDQLNDVWRSPDGGITWVCQNDGTNYYGETLDIWAPRARNSVSQINDIIMITGGWKKEYLTSRGFGDVWISSDYGVTWTIQSLNNLWGATGYYPPSTARIFHQVVHIPPDKTVLLAGVYGTPGSTTTIMNDVYISNDYGITWTSLGNAEWDARWNFAAVYVRPA